MPSLQLSPFASLDGSCLASKKNQSELIHNCGFWPILKLDTFCHQHHILMRDGMGNNLKSRPLLEVHWQNLTLSGLTDSIYDSCLPSQMKLVITCLLLSWVLVAAPVLQGFC